MDDAKSIMFLVVGSQPEPYQVVFTKVGARVWATCSCQAAHMGQHCRHRREVATGDTGDICSDNVDLVQEVVSWVKERPRASVDSVALAALEAELAALNKLRNAVSAKIKKLKADDESYMDKPTLTPETERALLAMPPVELAKRRPPREYTPEEIERHKSLFQRWDDEDAKRDKSDAF